MDPETRSDTPENNREPKTSFLIEDILYRGQNKKVPNHFEARRFDYEPKPFCLPERPHVPREGSYLQVMGALGAYLHTPNTYKAVETPYFLSQGKSFSFLMA